MNEIGVARRYFYCSQTWILTHNEMSKGERFLGAETAICIDQCFIITSITSSHTESRTRAKAPIIDKSWEGATASPPSDNFLFVSHYM